MKRLISEATYQPIPVPVEDAVDYKPGDKCPKCGSNIVLRTKGKYGPFLGCENFKGGCHFVYSLTGKEDLAKKWITEGNYGYSSSSKTGQSDPGDIQF